MSRTPSGLWIAWLFLFLMGCLDPVYEEIVEGPPPIRRITYWDARITVFSELDWKDLIKSHIFTGFYPGMTFEEAERTFGQPDKKGEGLWGPYYEYRRPEGTVSLSFEEVESGSTGEAFASWRLRAFPRDASLNQMLMPILLQRLDLPPGKRAEIVIMTPSGEMPAVEIIVEQDQVKSILWISKQ